ncbi:MAG: MFS transporter [Verrucomicrobia bacterium]|nr:MAG: MFS transporter [Verrucomicrobiota bacterium]
MDRVNISVAGPDLREDLGLSMVQMGLIFSAFGWTYSLLQIPGGIVVDLVRTRPLYGTIMFLWSAATLLQGAVNSLAALIGLRMSLGVFQAPSYPAHNKMVTRWFPDRERATAIAVYTSAQFLGLAALSPILAAVVGFGGWRTVFFVTGAISFAGVLLMMLFYRDPRDHPGVTPEELEEIRRGGGLVDEPSRAQHAQRPGFVWSDLAEAFRHRQLWGVYIGQYCLGALFLFFLTWFPTYLKEYRGLYLMTTGYLGAVPFLGAFCGVLLSGYLSDLMLRRGFSMSAARKTPVLCGMLLMTVVVAANYTENNALVIAFMTLAFFGNGLASIAWVFVSTLAPARCIGVVGGVFNFIGNLSGATVPSIIAWLARDGDFAPALIFIAVVSLIGFGSYLFLVGEVRRIEPAGR